MIWGKKELIIDRDSFFLNYLFALGSPRANVPEIAFRIPDLCSDPRRAQLPGNRDQLKAALPQENSQFLGP